MTLPLVPYTPPGIQVQAVGSPTLGSPGATGGVLGAIGTAPMGPAGVSNVTYTSYADFAQVYGDVASYPQYSLLWAAYLYFLQASSLGVGLRPGFVPERIGATLATKSLSDGSTGSLILNAQNAYAGSAGNAIQVTVAAQSNGTQLVTIQYTPAQGAAIQENYTITSATTPATQLASLIQSYPSALVSPGAAVDGTWFTAGTYNLSTGADGLGTAIAQAHFDAFAVGPAIDGIAPLDGLPATALLAMAHADAQSASFARPRVAYLGTTIIAGADHVAPLTTAITAVADANGRVVYFGHDGVLVPGPASPRTYQPVNGFYGAVMLAGAKFCRPVAYGLTMAQLVCGGPTTPLTDSQMNTLAQIGGTCLTNLYGGWTVRDGVTTAPGNSPYFRIGVRSQVDEVAKRLKVYYIGTVLGKPETTATPTDLQTGAIAVGSQAVKDGVISYVGTVPLPTRNSPGNWYQPLPVGPRWEMDSLTVGIDVQTS